MKQNSDSSPRTAWKILTEYQHRHAARIYTLLAGEAEESTLTPDQREVMKVLERADPTRKVLYFPFMGKLPTVAPKRKFLTPLVGKLPIL